MAKAKNRRLDNDPPREGSEEEEEEKEQEKIPPPSVTKSTGTPSKPHSSFTATEESGSDSPPPRTMPNTAAGGKRQAGKELKRGKKKMSTVVASPTASPKVDVVPVADGTDEVTNTVVEHGVVQFGNNIDNDPPHNSDAEEEEEEHEEEDDDEEEEGSSEDLRANKNVDADNLEKKDDSKKQYFQRVWSKDDEILILKGLNDALKKGIDKKEVHDSIRKSLLLHMDVSKEQVRGKLNKLKKKYENNVKKGKKMTFLNAHDQKVYDMSKEIWGNVGAVGNSKGEVKNTAIEQNARLSVSAGFSKNIDYSALENEIIRNGLGLISTPKRVGLEEKWKKLKVKEIKLYLERSELIHEQAKLILEALK